MRPLLVLAASLLAVTAAPLADWTLSAPAAVIGAPAPQAAPLTNLTTVQTTKKKKKESATIQTIGSVKHGKKDFEITAKVAKADRKCELEIKWADGSTDSPDDEDADSSKKCTFKIDVPSNSKVIGDATAKLTVRDGTNKKVASDQQTFSVK